MNDRNTPAPLDAAWAEVETALPDGWHMGEIKNTSYRGVNAAGQSERWLAMAWAEDDERTFESAYEDTPAAALRALAARLREAAR